MSHRQDLRDRHLVAVIGDQVIYDLVLVDCYLKPSVGYYYRNVAGWCW